MSPKRLTRRGSFGIILGVATCASAHARDVEANLQRLRTTGRCERARAGDWTLVGDDYPVFIRRRTIPEIEVVRAESISLLSEPARDDATGRNLGRK